MHVGFDTSCRGRLSATGLTLAAAGVFIALSLIGVPDRIRKKSKFELAEGDIAMIQEAISMYHAEHGDYPQDVLADHPGLVLLNDPGIAAYVTSAASAGECDPLSVKWMWEQRLGGHELRDPWGRHYHYFRRLTGRHPPFWAMAQYGVRDQEGHEYPVYDHRLASMKSEKTGRRVVGCGQRLNRGEVAKDIWIPPPAQGDSSVSPEDGDIGLMPFYIFSLGRDGLPGGGDDIDNWDPTKAWRRTYQGPKAPVAAR